MPAEVELLGALEHLLVAVGRDDHAEHLAALRQDGAPDLHVVEQGADGAARHRRGVAEELLHRRVDQLWLGPELELVLDEVEAQAPDGQPLDMGTLSRLPHLAWTVQEVERMRPSIDLLMRLAKEDIRFGDYVVPEGWLVQAVQVVSHNLPTVFERPGVFDPLRFSPGREEDRQHRFTTFGFDGGINKCPGMNFANSEMVVFTAVILRQFDLELLTPDPHVVSTLGANRASRCMVRYRRKP